MTGPTNGDSTRTGVASSANQRSRMPPRTSIEMNTKPSIAADPRSGCTSTRIAGGIVMSAGMTMSPMPSRTAAVRAK